MSAFSEYRLIDILSNVDISAIEEDVPDGDLDNPELFSCEEKENTGKRRITVLSGIVAAGSVVLTGAIFLLYRKYQKHAA